MLKVFILVNTRIGEAASVAKVLREVPGVISADAAIGLYDVIVEAKVEDAKALGKLVAFDIQCTPGVTSTLSCLVMDILAVQDAGRMGMRWCMTFRDRGAETGQNGLSPPLFT